MARRSNIRKRGRSWVAYIRIDGVQRQRSFPDLASAEVWIGEVKKKKHRGETEELLAPKKVRFRDFAREWLDVYARVNVRRRTFETYSDSIANHLVPAFGDLYLTGISRRLIDAFVADWLAGGPDYQERLQLAREREERDYAERFRRAREAEELLAFEERREPDPAAWLGVYRRPVRLGRSPGTISNALTPFKEMLGHAVEWNYLSRNPTLGVKRPRTQDGSGEMRVLSREQVERLVAAARPESQLAILTAAFTGLRRGELFALRWSDVDGPRRRLWVHRSVTRDGEFQQPKTRRSVRAVAIPDSLVRQLLEHRMASRFKGDDELVFPNEQGGPADAGNFVRREFKPALRRAKLPDVRWHDLRHTFASLLIAAGEHPKLVSEQLGHSGIAITMDRYGHLFDQSYGDASDRLEVALYGAAGASVLPAPASVETPSPAAPAQRGAVVPLERGIEAAAGGTA